MRIVVDLQSCQSTSRFRGIGRYSLSLVQAMARRKGEHELFIVLNGFLEDTVAGIRTAFNGLIPPGNIRVFAIPGPTKEIDQVNFERARLAELIREQFLSTLCPDVVLVSSLFEGLIDDVVTSVGKLFPGDRCAVILYDLIPLVYRQHYLSEECCRNWYFRKLQSLKNAGLLLAISEHSRREAIEILGIPGEKVVNISGGMDPRFRPLTLSSEQVQAIRERYGLTRDFILYTGGIDYRKNIEGLMKAYALLPHTLRQDYQLAIVCKVEDAERRLLESLACRLGLRDGEVILTGFVPDEDLVALYNLCALFVFPSLHEGLGLPLLEAMACGAPTIGSNTTSIPEIIGWDEALFDPRNPKDIATKIHQVLTDQSFRNALREHGLRRVQRFSWDKSALCALEALEALHQRTKITSFYILSGRRPRLAYVSPLPPEKTGVASYSAELLPELARFYDIELITDQPGVSDPWLLANFPIRPTSYFRANRKRYDRVLYQFGNSSYHAHMFGLLEEYPGTVVLHDFFLSGVLHWLEATDRLPGIFRQALYYSHGYAALLFEQERGREAAIWNYPCNLIVLQRAKGVVVHSEFARKMAEKWYGKDILRNLVVIPQPRAVRLLPDRRTARRRLGIDEDTFLVCSFGFLAPTKLSHRLLDAWLTSDLPRNGCHLVFVGEDQGNEYGLSLLRRAQESALRKSVTITGFVDSEIYEHYLAAADAAVQLRTRSRGETSRAVLDCLAAGIPLICNAHGANAELPEDVVIKLPDEFSDSDLQSALEHLYENPALRCELSRRAQEYIRAVHHPALIARKFWENIENFALESSKASYERLLAAIGDTVQRDLGEDEKMHLALSIASNQPSLAPARVFVDISVLARYDAGIGIQRVVRNILWWLLYEPLEGFRIEPVYEDEGQYHYARSAVARLCGLESAGFSDEWVDLHYGDVFLGLDLVAHRVPYIEGFLKKAKALGVPLYFVVYDLLPLTRPDCFPPEMHDLFTNWFTLVTRYADGLICISRTVADEVVQQIEFLQPSRKGPLKIGYFHLGADITSDPRSSLDLDEEGEVLDLLRRRPSFLMVGTIEPRKGYAQTLSAFERLWQEGFDLNLVIVGKQGWMVEELVDRLGSHPELNERLFWFRQASDQLLVKLYSTCTALLMASEGEGFGLPLVEAAQYGLPIIARDIAVFREVAGEHAFYFENTRSSEALAEALKEWLGLYREGKIPQSKNMSRLTWKESAHQLLDVIFGERWYKVWE